MWYKLGFIRFIKVFAFLLVSLSGLAKASLCGGFPLNSILELKLKSGGLNPVQKISFRVISCSIERGYELQEETQVKPSDLLLRGYFVDHDGRETEEIAFVNESDPNGLTPFEKGILKKRTSEVFLNCPPLQKWDEGFDTCIAENSGQSSHTLFMLHGYQYLNDAWTSGPRGQRALTGPDHFMMMIDRDMTSKTNLSLKLMGSLEPVLVRPCTPQLFQVDAVDCFGPHDYLVNMALKEVLSLGDKENKKIILEFGPKDDAAYGPVPYIMRDTATNQAPLQHGIQGMADTLHDTQWVTKGGFRWSQTLIEGSVFRGDNLGKWIGPYKQDSWSVRINQDLGTYISVGSSTGNIVIPNGNGPVHNRILSTWAATNSLIHGHDFKTETIWSQVRNNQTKKDLSSFLEEFLFNLRKNNFYGQVEVLQENPDDLNVLVTDRNTGAQWVKAVKGGYERNVTSKEHYNISPGFFVTESFTPNSESWQKAYGHGTLWGAWVSLKLSWSFHK